MLSACCGCSRSCTPAEDGDLPERQLPPGEIDGSKPERLRTAPAHMVMLWLALPFAAVILWQIFAD